MWKHCLLSTMVACFAVSETYAAQPKPAVITNVTAGGVGFVNVTSDTNGYQADIGQWGTPYTGGANGPPIAGAEPSGASVLTVEVDVNDGGILQFNYDLLSYDAGIYDWLDVNLNTPSGTIPIENHLGRPGGDWGEFFRSSPVQKSIPLDAYKNQHISLVFSVQQDGYGDETKAQVTGLTIASCSVAPLTDTATLASVYGTTLAQLNTFEAGNTLDTQDLSPSMISGLSCLQTAVSHAGGSLSVTSAYRPPGYQQHLREVFQKWNAPGNLSSNTDSACRTLKAQVQAEFSKHGLGASRISPAGPNGSHTQGLAFDARSSGVTDIDTLASGCQLYRRFKITDPVHFEHR